MVLVVVWFCLSFAFKGIGGIGLRLFHDAMREIRGEDPEKEVNERKEAAEE